MCYAAANIDYGRTALVFCFATMEQGNNKGSRVDLGTALISIGYAFASVTLDGRPVYSPYLIAETQAKNTKSGLWAYPDMPDPNAIILENYKPPKPAGPAPARRDHPRATRSLNKSTASFRGRPGRVRPFASNRMRSIAPQRYPDSSRRRQRPRSTRRRS